MLEATTAKAPPGKVWKQITVNRGGKSFQQKRLVNAPQAAKPTKADPAAVVAAVKAQLAGDPAKLTRGAVTKMKASLDALTVPQIKAIKAEHDLKGGRVKADHVEAILKRARQLKRDADASKKAAPKPEPSPAKTAAGKGKKKAADGSAKETPKVAEPVGAAGVWADFQAAPAGGPLKDAIGMALHNAGVTDPEMRSGLPPDVDAADLGRQLAEVYRAAHKAGDAATASALADAAVKLGGAVPDKPGDATKFTGKSHELIGGAVFPGDKATVAMPGVYAPDGTPWVKGQVVEDKFTGTDKLGRKWADGKLVAANDEPAAPKKGAKAEIARDRVAAAFDAVGSGERIAPPFPTAIDPATSSFPEHLNGLFDRPHPAIVNQEGDPIDVPLAGLVATQGDVTREQVLRGVGSTEPLVIARRDGQSYIFDGHGRATAAHLAGKTSVRARVYDYDPATGGYVPAALKPAKKAGTAPKAEPKKNAPAKPRGLSGPHTEPSGVTLSDVFTSSYAPKIRAKATELFGRDVFETPGLAAALSNGTDGASVYGQVNESGTKNLVIASTSPGVRAVRSFHRDGRGRLVAHNEMFKINKDYEPRPGEPKAPRGADLLANQVKALKSLGVDRIETLAAGDPTDKNGSGYVGWKVWPKLGFNGPIPKDVRAKLPPGLKAQLGTNTDVQSLIATPEGEKWWAENGKGVALKFDLKDGSPSMLKLEKYLAERDAKAGKK